MRKFKLITVLVVLVYGMLFGNLQLATSAIQTTDYFVYLPVVTKLLYPTGVIVLSSNPLPLSFTGTLRIVGEVLNNTASNVSINIYGTLRDTNGNVVDSAATSSYIDVVSPGMKSPFCIEFFDPPSWATYELVVTWSVEAYSQLYSLELLNHMSYFDSNNDYHVVGEIRNQYSVNRTSIMAYVTLYGSSGEVIGVEYSFTNPPDLAPGQTASFDTEVWNWLGKPDRNQVASISLQVISIDQ